MALILRGCRHPLSRHERGATLLEALFAFVVLALGTLAAGHLQGQLTVAGEIGRARATAVRLSNEAIEDMRSFAVTGAAASGVRSYAAIATGSADIAAPAGDRGGASFRVVHRIDDAMFAATKAASVQVGWRDRSGVAREVVLHSFIADIAPAYAGSLGIDAGTVPAAASGAFGRHAAVPVAAWNIGSGRSVWKPAAGGAAALVFDNVTGAVVERCDVAATTATRDLAAADLTRCTRGRWLAVGGTIRFSSALPALASAARETPLPTSVRLVLAGGPYPSAPECAVEAQKTVRDDAVRGLRFEDAAIDAAPATSGAPAVDTADRFAAWHCLVAPRADGRWSGRVVLEPTGWTIGTGSADRRVCRYIDDADGSGAIDANIEHPRDYVDVNGALVAQNFLVVRGSASCPASSVARVASTRSRSGDDPATEPHQP